MAKALVISVGSSVEPIVKSITEHNPEFISFLTSQDTCKNSCLAEELSRQTGCCFSTQRTIVDDPNDLFNCYSKAREAISRALSKGYQEEDITVDYTGGTKNMSVALSFAAVNLGVSFSYIGSQERDKEGTGIPKPGTEKVFTSINPWQFFAIEENIKIATLFNQSQFTAAKKLAEELSKKEIKGKTLYGKLAFVIEGYYQWDLFSHDKALHAFKRAKMDELLLDEQQPILKLFSETQALLLLLEQLVSVSKTKLPNEMFITDLFANAERRYEEGKIDDAILRLYRVLEMLAQVRLWVKYEVITSNVKLEQIPSELGDAFIKKYRTEGSEIKIPQHAAYSLLMAKNDELGAKYLSQCEEIKKIENGRNESYLAHGNRSSSSDVYQSFKRIVLDLAQIPESSLKLFPKICQDKFA